MQFCNSIKLWFWKHIVKLYLSPIYKQRSPSCCYLCRVLKSTGPLKDYCLHKSKAFFTISKTQGPTACYLGILFLNACLWLFNSLRPATSCVDHYGFLKRKLHVCLDIGDGQIPWTCVALSIYFFFQLWMYSQASASGFGLRWRSSRWI